MHIAFSASTTAENYQLPTMATTYGAQLVLWIDKTGNSGSDYALVQGSGNGTDWVTLTGTDLTDGSSDNQPGAGLGDGEQGLWRFDVTGLRELRIRRTGSDDTFSIRYEYSIA